MTPITVVVWDHVGNVMWGVRPWEEWTPHIQERLLAEDPDAIIYAPSIAQIFQSYQFDLRQVRTSDELAATIVNANLLIVHKEPVSPDVLRLGRRLPLIEHLGLAYRGIPIETTRGLGLPAAATPQLHEAAPCPAR